jgi:hypothetical protein
MLLSLLAVLAGGETFTDIARFGDKKLLLIRRVRPFRDGTPPPDRVGDIFATLDAGQFQRCFVAGMASATGRSLLDDRSVRLVLQVLTRLDEGGLLLRIRVDGVRICALTFPVFRVTRVVPRKRCTGAANHP